MTSTGPSKGAVYQSPIWSKIKLMLIHVLSQRPIRKQKGKYDNTTALVPSLPFQQFQVLFNSLFKVLCIFPSRYLCAIGLPPIFSFMWHLPQNLCWNPNQHDSLKACAMAHSSQTRTGVSPSQLPFSKGLGPGLQPTILLQTTIRCTQKTGVKWVTQIHTVSFTLFSRPY